MFWFVSLKPTPNPGLQSCPQSVRLDLLGICLLLFEFFGRFVFCRLVYTVFHISSEVERLHISTGPYLHRVFCRSVICPTRNKSDLYVVLCCAMLRVRPSAPLRRHSASASYLYIDGTRVLPAVAVALSGPSADGASNM